MQTSALTRRSFLRVPLAAGAGLAASTTVAAQGDTASAPRPAGITNGRLKQAGVHWCYGGPLEELAALCARLGMSGIDLVHPDQWPVLEKHGLVCTITPTMERGYGIGRGLNRPEHHEGHLEVIRERIDRNAEAGFDNILVFSGNRSDDLSDAEGLENCAAALRQIVGYAEEKGQVIQMELLNSKRDHKGYMCDRSRWGVDLVQKVGSDAFKILYDIYHAQIMEGDVIATIREHHEHFGHYHTAGVPGRRNLDENQELNYPAIMRAIAESGFAGFVAQEFIPEGDKVAALTQAVELCDV
ncbi:MAG: TIM barrel protein [Planctomycetota bacterium]|jgi:hydroxypyruvate isomerase|nr:TIM barrel protein [Planctomycetota bacterium]MDP6762250.1 TIM barrel protein [Planctomycetota bacterium]MDP6989351.1 TIM barrel protein [Planctomycetota bacterium]